MVLTLKGNPKSTNHIYKSTCRGKFASVYMTKEGKELKESYTWEARSQWKDKPLTGDVEMWIKLYFGDKRKRDIDNFNKLVLDALSGIVYEDDKQITKLTIEKFYDKENPRIEITI